MWEVARFPMAVRVPEFRDDEKGYGLTETMVRDAVELRLRANNIPMTPDALDSPIPHIFVLVRALGISGPGLDGVFYTANFNVRELEIQEIRDFISTIVPDPDAKPAAGTRRRPPISPASGDRQ